MRDQDEEGQVRHARQGDHRPANLLESGGLDRREAPHSDGRPAHAEAVARTRRDGVKGRRAVGGEGEIRSELGRGGGLETSAAGEGALVEG